MYDRKDAFEKSVEGRAEELIDVCGKLGISSFMTFCVGDDGKKTSYKNYMYGSASNGIHLTDDQITRHVNVANGFYTVPPFGDPDLDSYDPED